MIIIIIIIIIPGNIIARLTYHVKCVARYYDHAKYHAKCVTMVTPAKYHAK